MADDLANLPLPLNPAALQSALTQPQNSALPGGFEGGTPPFVSPDGGSPSQGTQEPANINLGSSDQPQPKQGGLPRLDGTPNLVKLFQNLFGDQSVRGYTGGMGSPGTAGAQPARPVSRLDAFESFLGHFLYSFSQGMAGGGEGPAANARGFGIAAQAPYQQQLQQYQLAQQRQMQQAQVGETQARTGLIGAQTTGADIENQINQRRLSMMGQAMMTGQDPVSSLGKLSSDEQAMVNAAKVESSMKGDMTPLLNVVDKITNNRALAQRQQVGITATNQRASQQLGEKMREFQITDEYRKWKENLDIQTKNKIAQLAQNKAPAAMQESAVFAKSGLNRLADAQQAMDELKASGVMGTLPANKVEDWIFGKGLVDPSLDAKTRQTIGKLRSALSYTSTAAMRSHTGRTSQEIFDDFKNTLGPGQDWDALTGAMDETRSMLTEYATAPSDANIRAMRAGQSLATGGGGATPKANTQYSPNNPFAPKK